MRPAFRKFLALSALLWPDVNGIPATIRTSGPPIAPQESVSGCSNGATIEDLWLVDHLNVTYTDNELVRPGNASWTITNNMTNASKRIDCVLRANYICELESTLGNESLHLWLQINLDVATFTINQSVACGSEAASGCVPGILRTIHCLCDC
jgi:hypothetical protein